MPLNTDDHPDRLAIKSDSNKQVAYCRCWQSSTFPFCDGSHRAYNAKHGDRVGPLVVLPESDDGS